MSDEIVDQILGLMRIGIDAKAGEMLVQPSVPRPVPGRVRKRRCGTCKHWEHPGDDNPLGECLAQCVGWWTQADDRLGCAGWGGR